MKMNNGSNFANSFSFFFRLYRLVQVLMSVGATFHNLIASLMHVLASKAVAPCSTGVLFVIDLVAT